MAGHLAGRDQRSMYVRAPRRLGWLLALVLIIETVAIGGPVPGSLGVVDVTPPQLKAFSFSPGSIDTSSGDRTITVSAHITDDSAGAGGTASLYGTSYVTFTSVGAKQSVTARFSELERVMGTALDGIYKSTMTVPQYSYPGTWTVGSVVLVDTAGNRHDLSATDLSTNGWATTFTQSGVGDTTPPVLAGFTLTPTWVDTSSGDQTMTFTAHITDDLVGVADGSFTTTPSSVAFESPSGTQSVEVAFTALKRVSGDALDGVYTATATMPHSWEEGTWTMIALQLADQVGNMDWLLPGSVAALGFATEFIHTRTTDATAPELKAFSFTPTSVDTSSSERTITFTARITDAGSGLTDTGEVSYARFTAPSFIAPSDGQTLDAVFAAPERISGNAKDGVYRYTATLPRHAEEGTWNVSEVVLIDLVGNKRVLGYTDLSAAGLPVSFYQAGAGDTLAPYLEAFTVTPSSVDIAGGSQTITLTARVTDAVAGISSTPAFGAVRFASSSTTEEVKVSFLAVDRVSGDEFDGVYSTTVTVPSTAELGIWTVDGFDLVDAAGNASHLTAADLVSLGFPASFTVTKSGDTTPPQLADFSFTPTSVNTSSGDRTITFTARITDDTSGVSTGIAKPGSMVVFFSPSGLQSLSAIFTHGQRVSGTANDGVYTYEATIPRYGEQGTWSVKYFQLVDEAGNGVELSVSDVAAGGYPTTFTQTGAGDSMPPRLTAFSLTPSSVDTSSGDRSIVFTARITDDLTGVNDLVTGSLRFESPSATRFVDIAFDSSLRISGDALDGIYAATVTIPKGTEEGTWTVMDFYVNDRIGNSRVLTATDLATMGFPSTFEVARRGTPLPTDAVTVGLVDPLQGKWRLRNSAGDEVSFFFGNPGDYPFMGDWDCDGIDTPGMYRQSDGYVYLRNTNTQGIADIKFFFGNPGDMPIAGDFNADGCDTVSIYRPSNQTFYIINALGENDGGLGAADLSYVFGNPGDKPFVGDFDGDGVTTVGLHRESTGLVYFRNTHTQGVAHAQFIYGDPGDRLVAGDWNADGADSPALFRPSNTTYYFRYTNTQGVADAQFVYGGAAWLPVAGHFGLG